MFKKKLQLLKVGHHQVVAGLNLADGKNQVAHQTDGLHPVDIHPVVTAAPGITAGIKLYPSKAANL